MCGIAGIININNTKVSYEDIKLMTDIITHRGPDGEGHFVSENIGFGHRRLAILDLSKAGHQPMIKNDIVLVFNGEIYNYLEIREELEALGEEFNTNTDTEVVIKAYKQWSYQCVKKFNGMWAFALFDKNEDKIFISRDRFGIKPFYYFENNSQFYFGSEIKQILPFLTSTKVNKQILYDFLYLSFYE